MMAIIAPAAALALLAAAAAIAFGGGGAIWKMDRAARKIDRALSRRLAERHGLDFYADFDGALPSDAVSLASAVCLNAPRVETPCGFGRRVKPGHRRSFLIASSQPLKNRSSATYSMMLAPDTLAGCQEVLSAASEAGLAVRIEDGWAKAALFDGPDTFEASARWPAPPGRFVALAVAVSEDALALYMDGELACRKALPRPVPPQTRLLALPANVRYPYAGAIDELAVWTRALSAGEVRKFCGGGNLAWSLEPALCARREMLRRALAFCSAAMRAAGRFVPHRGGPAVMRSVIPALVLHTAPGDDRHFLKAHENSLFSGYRTAKAAKPRRIGASFGGRRARIDACLEDIYGREPVCRRPAFVLRGDFPELIGGCGMARLYPPEAHSLVHVDAGDVLPLSGRFVRLYEGKTFRGIYAIEPFDAQGSAWMVHGETHRALYFNGRPKPSDLPPQGVSPHDARRAIDAIAISDHLFPWSAAELQAKRGRLVEKRRRLGFAEFRNAVAPVDAILGGNRAPMFITGDLDLGAAGAGIVWRSSDAGTISPDGAVARPEGVGHRIVTLTAENQATGASQEYRLRVMGKRRTLPTLFVSIGEMPSKERKIDFSAVLVRAGGEEEAEVLAGLAGEGCGLRHRGNTAYVKGVKRPMSLKFRDPIDWPDPAHPARRILLCGGRADPTRLRNKIAFDAFNAAFADGGFPATRYSHCELFVNGEWVGVWEACGSVRDLLPEGSLLYKIRSYSTSLWRVNDTGMLDCVAKPGGLEGDPYAPISDLFAFTSSAPKAAFAREVASRFHIDNLVGYFAVANFTCHADGIFMNQYLARRPGEDRFLMVPWDCDETFHESNLRHIFSNYLFTRLMKRYPGARALLRRKWCELRDGALSDEAVFGRIDADAAALAPYMDEEWRLLKPEGFDGNFDMAVEQLKDAVRSQLSFLDGRWH